MDLNKIRFSYLHYILQYSCSFGLESEKLESLYWYLEKTQGHSIGPLPWSRYANTTLIYDKVSIYCVLLTPQWKQSLRSSSMQVGETWSLKFSIARLDKQNRKFPPILIITEAKNAYFLCAHEPGLSMKNSEILQKWLWLESLTVTRFQSSHSVKNVTPVTIFSTWLESSHQKSWLESSHQKSWLKSSHWLKSRYSEFALGELRPPCSPSLHLWETLRRRYIALKRAFERFLLEKWAMVNMTLSAGWGNGGHKPFFLKENVK